MKIILHIGIHKTGTTSIQYFCTRNARFLQEFGVHYGLRKNLFHNVNFIGIWLAQERHEEVKAYFEGVLHEAARSRMNSLLLSGESLFAINRRSPGVDAISGKAYWLREEKSVNALASMLSGHEVEVICYVRRQDVWVESFYNQMIKSRNDIMCSIEEFLQYKYVNYMLDFYRHLEIWAHSFGDSALKLGVFDPKKDVVADFLGLALGISEVPENISSRVHVNERLSSELLEFKRDLNRQQMSRPRRFLSDRAILELSAEFAGNEGPLLTYEQRKRITECYRSGNKALAERWLSEMEYPFEDFPEDGSGSSGSVRLTPTRRKEIESKYRRIMRRPSLVAEMVLKKTFGEIERLLPFGHDLFHLVRQYRYEHQILNNFKLWKEQKKKHKRYGQGIS